MALLLRATVGAGLLLGLLAFGRAQAALEWKFKEGEKFFVVTTTTTKETVTLREKDKKPVEAKTTSTYTTVSRFVVDKVTADKVTLTQTIETVKVESDDPAAANTERFAKLLEGAAFTVTLSPRGKLLGLDGFDDLIKKASDGTEASERAARAVLSEDNYKVELGNVFGFLPDEAGKATWSRDETFQVPWGSLKGKTEYSDKGGGKIAVSRSWTYKEPKEAFGGVTLKGSLTVEQATGDIVFDADAGKLVRQDMKVTLTGKMTRSEATKPAKPFDVDETVTRSFRITDKNPLAEKKDEKK